MAKAKQLSCPIRDSFSGIVKMQKESRFLLNLEAFPHILVEREKVDSLTVSHHATRVTLGMVAVEKKGIVGKITSSFLHFLYDNILIPNLNKNRYYNESIQFLHHQLDSRVKTSMKVAINEAVFQAKRQIFLQDF
ncbi:unnamed protein product [Dovyalis caffra]|uniref:Uncharacterized protein n=1 Tax=Dovyalis caffra TaxID=77055 RepID=A0AAV1REZ3_9ROSI|nr:unnamed protein product [Dovyalis caffra]